ncbi:MAG: Gfo/Idh/MocA family oxidoreductase [Candidatus Pristimantibacillus lignocellulolyticus]|uniref:Gfo/Idh/MocA family oxidoreductase n=1 Tax=Candidatus Pristimantibacillus lignocellulolyticus TaxID=2994561 RepID=A0A9J6ZA02_9BACL|nr:MAG: Gfo/Idh/MocA family oxidoreductase [Candidatus Pristimantibacillus lignocellulolyticus]
MNNSDGMNYAPIGKQVNVVEQGEFQFAAIALEHGHIYGMCNGLREAGATLKWVYDEDQEKVAQFVATYPGVQIAESLAEILHDSTIQLVAAAAIPNERAELGIRVMEAGKHYFTDKAPFTTFEQLEQVKEVVARTNCKYAVYYSERIHVESAVYAEQLIGQGAIGRVIQMIGLGPHRLNESSRPSWFFNKEQYGGILCDIASHQIEQFLYFSGNNDARITSSQVANYNNKHRAELEDFGDIHLVGENGATAYIRVDWLTPEGLSSWGDGRTIILGTDGYIELRKYVDITKSASGDHLFLVNKQGEQYWNTQGKVGFPFFSQFILDCMYNTENAMTQNHIFRVAELTLLAQQQAIVVE